MISTDIYEAITEIIHEETMYLRHYIGQVVSTRIQRNGSTQIYQVQAALLELGFIDQSTAIWCSPRQARSAIQPEIGDYVEVYFMNGDSGRGVYLYPISEIVDLGFQTISEGKDIIYQDKQDQIEIHFDKNANELSIGKTDLQAAARQNDEILSDNTTDSTWWGYWNAFFAVITGAIINEPGNGAPSALQTALKAAVQSASVTIPAELKGKINEGSDQVKIGKK